MVPLVEQTDLAAALYAAVHTGTVGDRGFYTDVCKGGRAVLELGCGGGRLLPVLAGVGRRVVGLDHDDALLGVARKTVEALDLDARVRLVHGDMRTFTIERRFDRIVLAFNGLWCLPGPDAMQQALANAARHLTPKGKLALDVYKADAFHSEAEPDDLADDALHPVAEVEVDGTQWLVQERSAWDPAAQRIDATYVHSAADGRTATTTIRHHYLLRDALTTMLENAGLQVIQMTEGLANDESLLVVCGRAD